MVGTTSDGSAMTDRPTKNTPSPKSSRRSAAAWSASLVLPAPPGTGQGQQADIGTAQELDDLRQLALSADQRRRLGRKVGRPVLERCERRKLALEAFRHELEDPLRPAQVLQPMLAEIAEGELLWEIVLDELSRRLRDEHLAAVACRGNAGAAVDVHSDVALVGSQRLARCGCPCAPGSGLRRERAAHPLRRRLRLLPG